MKNLLFASLIILLALGAAVYAQAPGDYGLGWGMGWGHGMGPVVMRGGAGPYGSPSSGASWGGPGSTQSKISDENAKTTAQQYADKYFEGYKVERVLPFTGMGGMTMFQAELSRPNGELRLLHVNPWGNVMPFGGPQPRGR